MWGEAPIVGKEEPMVDSLHPTFFACSCAPTAIENKYFSCGPSLSSVRRSLLWPVPRFGRTTSSVAKSTNKYVYHM